METKHKPATPLTEAWVMEEYGDRPGKPLTAAECLEWARRLERDRAQLVAALRGMVGAHGNVEQWWETEGEHRFQNQIDNLNLPRPTAEVIRQQVTDETTALLRELGEME